MNKPADNRHPTPNVDVPRSMRTRLPTHLAEGRFAPFDAEDPTVRDIVAAQGRARKSLESIHRFHELAMTNPNETPVANMRASKLHAEKKQAEALAVIDAQRKRTRAEVTRMQSEIDASLERGALKWPFAAETRQHVKSLPADKREAFVADALARGDTLAAGAVLGVPPYLSGLTEATQAVYLHRYKAEAFPDYMKRIESLTEAQEILDAGGASILDAVGGLVNEAELAKAEKHAALMREAEAS